jgi:multiple sugar transport system permease protein
MTSGGGTVVGSPLELAGTRSGSKWHRFLRRGTPYLLLLPALVVVAVTVFYPMAWAVSLSTHKYVLYEPKDTPFIGLANFGMVLADRVFWQSIKNTGIWVGLIVSGQLLIGFFAAILLNERFRGRGIVRSLILIPWVTPSILAAFMWRWMYNINYGVINRALVDLGIIPQHIGFLSDANLALYAVIVVIIWAGAPFFALMILAAMQAIPEELYEAATVDGATSLHRLRFITLPLIAPTIAVTSLLRIIWVANYVDILFTMTHGGPGTSSMTLPVYVFIKARSSLDMGYSSAMALILAAILIVIVMIYLSAMKKMEVHLR